MSLLTDAQRSAILTALAMPQDTREQRDARSEAKHRAFSCLVNSDPESSFGFDDILDYLTRADGYIRFLLTSWKLDAEDTGATESETLERCAKELAMLARKVA